MNVGGLENNYYLSGNDVWVNIESDEAKTFDYVLLTVTNNSTSVSLSAFKLYPSPNNDFYFNISIPVCGLFTLPSATNLNSFTFQIDAFYKDESTETLTIEKYFIRGGVDRWQNDNFYLNNYQPLIIGEWVIFNDISMPFNPQRIVDGEIVEFIPLNPRKIFIPYNCNHKIIRWLNSLGGWQYWIFESHETQTKSKDDDTISVIPNNLQSDNFRNLGTTATKTIDLFSKVPMDLQPIIEDLVLAHEVQIFENGNWQRLKLKNNTSTENTWERVFENKISFEIQINARRKL